MQLIIILTLIAVVSAAQLPSRNYLPQAQGGSAQSGGFQQSFQQSQSFQSSHSSSLGGAGGSGDTGNRRSQQEQEKNAAVVKLDQEVNGETGDFHYSYETSNGIRAEEAGNAAQSSGGFSYKGDDGNTYTVTFTAGEGGFRPQGAHLPVPPPIPQEILVALEQNAKDEAAGIFDDGKYHPEANGGGSGQGHKGSGSFSSSSSGSSGSFSSSSSSSSSQFGSANHQGSFNSNSGYSY